MSILFHRTTSIRAFWLYIKQDPFWSITSLSTGLFVFAALLYVLLSHFFLSFFPSGDEPHFLIISQTLVKYHSLSVGLDYTNGDYRDFYPLHIDPHTVYNMAGQLLPLHSIGGPLLWLLPFWLLGRLGAVLFTTCLSIFIIVNIYKLLLAMGFNDKIAFQVCLAYTIATPFFTYSHLNFIEPIGAFVCIYLVRVLFEQKLTPGRMLFCGLLLGILPWVHIRFALLEMVLFFSLLYQLYQQYGLRSFKPYLAYLFPVVALFVGLELYNYFVWGSLNPAANQIADGSTAFEVLPFKGIFLGLLFDQEYGLLFVAPVFLLMLVGAALALRQKRFLAYNLCILALSVPYIIMFTTFRHWSGGWNPAGRFILVLLPLYALYIAYALERVQSRLLRRWWRFSLVYGAVYNVLSFLPPTNGFNGESGHTIVLNMFRVGDVRLSDFLPTVFTCKQNSCIHPMFYETVVFVFWITFFIVLIGVMLWSASKQGKSRSDALQVASRS